MLSVVLLGALAISGCARSQAPPVSPERSPERTSAPGSAAGTPPDQRLIVTPEHGLIGKVVRVNVSGQFVVLNFPRGRVPVLDQHLNVYRFGLKVGEVKVTGPQQEENIVGDLVSGDAQPGDEVRDK